MPWRRWMKPWRPAFEFNVEGYPDARFFEIVEDGAAGAVHSGAGWRADVLTSDEGWKLGDAELPMLRDCRGPAEGDLGCRIILFVDPNPAVVATGSGDGGGWH